jgi:hypothetical protein
MNNHIAFGLPLARIEFPGVSSTLEYLQEYSRLLGYCIVIRSSKKDKNGQHFRSYFQYDRGAGYIDRTKPCSKPRKKRSTDGVLAGTGSRKTNCLFQLRLQLEFDGL